MANDLRISFYYLSPDSQNGMNSPPTPLEPEFPSTCLTKYHKIINSIPIIGSATALFNREMIHHYYKRIGASRASLEDRIKVFKFLLSNESWAQVNIIMGVFIDILGFKYPPENNIYFPVGFGLFLGIMAVKQGLSCFEFRKELNRLELQRNSELANHSFVSLHTDFI